MGNETMDGTRMTGSETGEPIEVADDAPDTRTPPRREGSPRPNGRAREAPAGREAEVANATPMMQQYIEIRAANPDCLLFYRMGDFYELFFDDAVEAARALGIHLTKRGKHLGEDIPMCGVPVATADDYLQKLIALGYRVAVCEQLEDPAEARKRGGKSVVKRDVVRLVTPGTITEERLLDPARANHLAALSRVRSSGEDAHALAWVELSTGAFNVALVPVERLGAEIARVAPAELIVPEALWSDTALRPVIDGAGVPVQPQDASCFDAAAAPDRLTRALGVATLDAFGAFERAELSAMAGVVGYLEATQKADRPALRPPVREADGGHMLIDAPTRASLELERTASGAREGSLLAAMDRTVTGGGARLLAERLRAPLTDPAMIDARLDGVAWLVANDSVRDAMRGHLRGVPDMERALTRLALGRGRPSDLVAVRGALEGAEALAARVDGLDLPDELAAARDGLAAAPGDLADALDVLSDEPPAQARDGGLVRPGALPDLDEQRSLRERARELVMALQADYAAATGVRSLRIKHNNVLGYFAEANAAHEGAIRGCEAPAFRHRQTLASAMRFTTDELSDLQARIEGAAEAALAIEIDAFARLTGACVDAATELRRTCDALAVLDVTAALARLAEGEGYCRPQVDASLDFAITAGRHPVVEQALRASASMPFVTNDADLSPPDGTDRGAVWLLTGPNMGGKSTFLRQCALVAVMAQAGSFVPAGAARIGVVDRLFSRVGASDDLARGRSTFMVEMVETAAILAQATERSLVILDEIGRGTSTHDGLSIAWASVEHLHEAIGPRALFATHFHELCALAERLLRLSCHAVRVEEAGGEIVFLHAVAPGSADRSYGVEVARLAGLPAGVVARAEAILDRLEGRHDGNGEHDDGPALNAADALADLPLFGAMDAAPAPRASKGAKADPAAEALKARVAALAPDEMTPRDAMEAVYALKAMLAD